MLARGRNVVSDLFPVLGKVNRFVSDNGHHHACHEQQGYHGRQRRGHRYDGQQPDRGYQAIDSDRLGDSPLEDDMSEQIDRHSSVKRIEADAGEGVAELMVFGISQVLEHFLQPECQHDDSDQHRKVEKAVGIARQTGTGGLRLLGQGMLALEGGDVEVGPPQRRRQHESGG